MSGTAPDMESLKTKLKGMWMAGDFGQIAKHIETAAEEFIARLNLKPGDRVLDVACGTGNLAIPAARAGAIVSGADIATNLIEQARARAASEGLTIQFDEGDAESLPYDDASFDAVVTMFGAMFAPRPELVSAELVRVCRFRRTNCHGELDSRRIHRPDVQGHRQACAAATRDAFSAEVGR